MKKLAYTLAVTMTLAAAPLKAEEGGTITGTLEGEPVEWTFRADRSQYLDLKSAGYFLTVSTNKGQFPGRSDALQLNLTATLSGANARAPKLRLHDHPRGISYSGEGEAVELVLTQAEVQDDTLSIAGTLRGTVIGESQYTEGEELAVELQIEGRIDKAGGSH